MKRFHSYLRSIPKQPTHFTQLSYAPQLCTGLNKTISNSQFSTSSLLLQKSFRCITSEKAPKAVGPYSQAVKTKDGTIYISGCLGLVPETGEFPDGDDVVAQAKQALRNMSYVLEEAGATSDSVVKTTVLLEDIDDFQAVNEVYSVFFGDHKPARVCYAVNKLPKGAKVEIEAIALADAE